MTCQEFADFLDDYFDGSQPEEVRATFEAHLEECDDCRHYLVGYRVTVQLGKSLCDDPAGPIPDEVPDDLISAVLTAMRDSPPASQR